MPMVGLGLGFTMNRLLLLSETNYKYLKKKKKVIVILCEAQEVSIRWQVNGGGGR